MMRPEVWGAQMDQLGAGVLVLAGRSEGHREHLAAGARLHHVDGRVFHRQPAAQVAVDPFHQRIAVGHRPLGDQVVDVIGPVLDGGVTDARAALGDHLDHGRVQAFGAVHGGRAAFDVMHLGALVDDDQRPLELAHVGRIDAEIGLQGELDLHPLRYVDERAARPDRRIERGELVVGRGDDRAEILAQQVGMLAEGRVGVGEDHALPRHLFPQRTVDHLALVLGLHAGEELLLGLGNAQPIEGVLDLRRHFVPRLHLAVGRLQVIVDVLELDGDIAAPAGHRLGIENLQALQAKVPHPGGLVLHFRDFGDDLPVQALAGLEHVLLFVAKIVFVDFADGVNSYIGSHDRG